MADHLSFVYCPFRQKMFCLQSQIMMSPKTCLLCSVDTLFDFDLHKKVVMLIGVTKISDQELYNIP